MVTVANDIPAGEYAEAVAQYRAAQFSEAEVQIRAIPREKLERVFDFFRASDWLDSCLFAAALLHTASRRRAVVREKRATISIIRTPDADSRLVHIWEISYP